jgi:hypothetical protein
MRYSFSGVVDRTGYGLRQGAGEAATVEVSRFSGRSAGIRPTEFKGGTDLPA